jgi:hypothetical protein
VAKTTAQVLREARELISTRDRWASDWSELARGHCMATAVPHPGPAYDLLLEATGSPVGGLSSYNDSHSHAEVLAVFDTAIVLAEAEE